jgi:hypothetical protein
VPSAFVSLGGEFFVDRSAGGPWGLYRTQTLLHRSAFFRGIILHTLWRNPGSVALRPRSAVNTETA